MSNAFHDICSHPYFLIAAGIATGIVVGGGLMITYLAKYLQKKLQEGAVIAMEPRENYTCAQHQVFANGIKSLEQGQVRMEAKQDRLEEKLDRVLFHQIESKNGR